MILMLDFFKAVFRWRYLVIRWWQRVKARLRTPLAGLWRPLLFRTTFIAVCGSVGKTTTKEILAAVLGHDYPVAKTSGTWGGFKLGGVAGTILSVRPWHRFAIVEAAIESKGQMSKMAQLIKPDMVIVLAVKECHMMEFKTLENVAAEKSEMLKALSPSGIAVLNGDDAMVAEMSGVGNFRVVRFGFAGCEVSAEDVSSKWPDRLRLTLQEAGGKYSVKSRLVGTHWVNSILAAVAAARHCGVTLERAIPIIEAFEPFWARMQPVTLDNGVTFLRDEFNGSYDTFQEAFKVLEDATASRKIAVVSEYSDSHKSLKSRVRVKRLARELAAHVDIVIFVGERADYGRDAAVAAAIDSESVFSAFDTKEAAGVLKDILQSGDLVLIKGKASHHLSRVYLDFFDTVTCKLATCPRQHLCDRCGQLGFSWNKKYANLMAPPDVFV